MEERYVFDKRVMKKIFIKYGTMALIMFPILITVNYFLNKFLQFWLVVVIDCVLILAMGFLMYSIIEAVKRKKEESEKDFVVIKAKEIKAKRNSENKKNTNTKD